MTQLRHLATILLLTLALLAVPSAAGAGSGVYVALGDSFASGVGTRSYDDTSGSCLRSAKAYPVLVAERLGLTLRHRACSGADVAHVRDHQLGALSATTSRVTLQVGGNDAGFSDVIVACAQPSWSADCNAAVDRAQRFIAGTLGERLDNLYALVSTRAPGARVVVVGYPRLFAGEDCNAGTWFSPKEMERLNATADQLNARTRERAVAAGFGFVNPTKAYLGHAVCADVEWVNGLSQPVRESYHPNVRGQRGYSRLVDDRLA